jgi:release factor glutamine methyltransferase
MNIKEILRDAKSQLAESGITEIDAEHLLAHVLGLHSNGFTQFSIS